MLVRHATSLATASSSARLVLRRTTTGMSAGHRRHFNTRSDLISSPAPPQVPFIAQRRSFSLASTSPPTATTSRSKWLLSAGLLISLFVTAAAAARSNGNTTVQAKAAENAEQKASEDDNSSANSENGEKEESTTTPPNLKQVWKLAPLYGRIHSLEDLSIELFQYEACPFCCKVKTYLDYHKIPYKIIEVNPVFKKEMRDSKYKRVPFIKVNGIQINDSSNIINEIHQLLNPGYFDFDRLGKEETVQQQERSAGQLSKREERERELRWRSWVDSRLVHLLPPNIYRTYGESIQAFDYITDVANFSWSQKIAAKWGGSTAMYMVSKRLKTKYNIVDERKELYECMNMWMDEVDSTGKSFLGGDSPNMADLQVYGVLTSIEGLDTYHDMRKNSRAGVWYDRMKEAVGESSRLNNFRKNAHNTVTVVK